MESRLLLLILSLSSSVVETISFAVIKGTIRFGLLYLPERERVCIEFDIALLIVVLPLPHCPLIITPNLLGGLFVNNVAILSMTAFVSAVKTGVLFLDRTSALIADLSSVTASSLVHSSLKRLEILRRWNSHDVSCSSFVKRVFISIEFCFFVDQPLIFESRPRLDNRH